jgi:hypothetical protein
MILERDVCHEWTAATIRCPRGSGGLPTGGHGPASEASRCSAIWSRRYWEHESLRQTAEVGKEAGIAWTLAWEIGAANDYDFGKGFTPEERWERMLAWVRNQMIPADVTA